MVVKPMFVNSVPYVFQEIRNIHTNSVFGYEALIRPENIPAKDYINSAMMMGGTHQLERDTFFNAIKAFSELRLPGRLFINSFPNDNLDLHESKILADTYGKEIMSRVVVQVLEYPFFNQAMWFEKRRFMLRYDMLSAVNAIGDGVFSDFSSLNVYQPDIVTIPEHVIRDFYEDEQRTEYVKQLVEYLKSKDYTVLAVGVENVLEYQMLADFGVDLAQGYYIGMPSLPDAPEFIPDGDTRKFTD